MTVATASREEAALVTMATASREEAAPVTMATASREEAAPVTMATARHPRKLLSRDVKALPVTDRVRRLCVN